MNKVDAQFSIEKCVFVDIEVNSMQHREPIQISYSVGLENAKTEYFKPDNPIDIYTMSCHHITDQIVSDFSNFKDSGMLLEFVKLNEEGYIFVSHNTEFDIQIINKYLTSSGFHSVHNVLCTLLTSRYLHKNKVQTKTPEIYKLQYLRYFYEIDTFGLCIVPHQADSDVYILKGILQSLLDTFSVSIKQLTNLSTYLLRPENYEMPFGKHKEKKLVDIYNVDASYLHWFVNNMDSEDIIRKIVLFLESTVENKK